jgi:hypothetical protein
LHQEPPDTTGASGLLVLGALASGCVVAGADGVDSCGEVGCDGAACCEPAPDSDVPGCVGADSDWPEPDPLPWLPDACGSCAGACSGGSLVLEPFDSLWLERGDAVPELEARGVVLDDPVLTVRPGNAFAATAVSAPVRTVVPARSQRLLRTSLRRAASRVAGVWV